MSAVTETEMARQAVDVDRIRVRARCADALRREINSWVDEVDHYAHCFTDQQLADVAALLKLSRKLHRSLNK